MYIDYIIYVVSGYAIPKCVNIIVGFNCFRATVARRKTEKGVQLRQIKKKINCNLNKMTNYDDLMHMYVMAVSL